MKVVGQKSKRTFDWIEIGIFVVLLFYVYQVTPRAQEYVSRRTTDLPNATSSVISGHVVVTTDQGNLKFGLLPHAAPNHIQQFLKAIDDKFYEGCGFYWIRHSFLQAGCMKAKPNKKLPPMKLEYKLANTKGRVFMARDLDDPSSATSEWAINLQDNSADLAPGGWDPHGYTVFMELVEGWDVIKKIVSAGGASIKQMKYEEEEE